MWLFTKWGFFSAVTARKRLRPKPGEKYVRYSKTLDKGKLMVRARVREHLEALRARFHKLIGAAEILESESADYRFRMIVKKQQWTEIATALADEIEYGNFKDECKHNVQQTGWDYVNALMRVWGIMYGVQQGRNSKSLFDPDEDDFTTLFDDEDPQDGSEPVLITG